MWLDNHTFGKKLGWWNNFIVEGRPNYVFMEKLKRLKSILKKWNKDVFGNVLSHKNLSTDKIHSLDSLEESNSFNEERKKERDECEKDLLDINVKEQPLWANAKLRSCKRGMRILTHSCWVSAQKSKNIIYALENSEGWLLLKEDEIVDEILSFYEQLYGSRIDQPFTFDGLNWKSLNPTDSSTLQVSFEKKELREVVLYLGNIKFLGPNGMLGVSVALLKVSQGNREALVPTREQVS